MTVWIGDVVFVTVGLGPRAQTKKPVANLNLYYVFSKPKLTTAYSVAPIMISTRSAARVDTIM